MCPRCPFSLHQLHRATSRPRIEAQILASQAAISHGVWTAPPEQSHHHVPPAPRLQIAGYECIWKPPDSFPTMVFSIAGPCARCAHGAWSSSVLDRRLPLRHAPVVVARSNHNAPIGHPSILEEDLLREQEQFPCLQIQE